MLDRLSIKKATQTPVTVPIANDIIIREDGVTLYISNAVIIKHMITARPDVIIIRLLFFISFGVTD